jgi:hypothetical protein
MFCFIFIYLVNNIESGLVFEYGTSSILIIICVVFSIVESICHATISFEPESSTLWGDPLLDEADKLQVSHENELAKDLKYSVGILRRVQSSLLYRIQHLRFQGGSVASSYETNVFPSYFSTCITKLTVEAMVTITRGTEIFQIRTSTIQHVSYLLASTKTLAVLLYTFGCQVRWKIFALEFLIISL